jgi:hypothetical protein
VIIRETEKTFWHVEDMPGMTLEQLVQYRTGGRRRIKNIMLNAA